MNWKKALTKLAKQKRGIVGLEAAIVLIAFVIIAAIFGFMVVNQGLFATERGKTVIQEGLKQASTPLSIDGTTFARTNAEGSNVSVIVVPLRAFGVKYVAMWRNQTVVTLKVGESAWANVYLGVLYDSADTDETYDSTGMKFDDFVGYTESGGKSVNGTYGTGPTITGAVLAISNSNGDESLDAAEKGYLIVTLKPEDAAAVRNDITVEVRLEKTAPLSLEFTIPESMPKDTYVPV
ncbi:MAG: hypothetical protein OEX76_06210 [Candidatus Bathyarchaeota archaeon]|nr:hypothetical protein [Candidatus Bathyarchaeota archaeon]